MQRAAAESDDDVPMPSRLDALASRGSSRSAASSRYSRPGSAVINLRGSRPNSAAIAQEIEGFEDDFMVGTVQDACALFERSAGRLYGRRRAATTRKNTHAVDRAYWHVRARGKRPQAPSVACLPSTIAGIA